MKKDLTQTFRYLKTTTGKPEAGVLRVSLWVFSVPGRILSGYYSEAKLDLRTLPAVTALSVQLKLPE